MEEMTLKEFIHFFQSTFYKQLKKERFCCCPNCNNRAIRSHVFQENRILKPIAKDSKVYQFHYNSLFNPQKIGYKLEGINKAFSFNGYCNFHDNGLFAPIEKNNENIDWTDKYNQFLLGYKSICNELFRVNVGIETLDIVSKETYSTQSFKIIWAKSNLNGLKLVLERYKNLFENYLLEQIECDNYSFETIIFPFQIDLCISSPIQIEGIRSYNYNTGMKETNIVNMFPYNGTTIIILGYSEGFDNNWIKKISNKLQSKNSIEISSAIQDVLFHAEFHCMSKNLYDEIGVKMQKFLDEWYENRTNYDMELKYTSNILSDYISKIANFK